MKFFILSLTLILLLSCSKTVEIELPGYEPETVVEMYLEDGAPLRCLLSESLPYTSTAINKPVDSALVIFSDGKTSDTLRQTNIYDYESGRKQNYANSKILAADTAKTFTLRIVDSRSREIKATTRFAQRITKIDSVVYRPSANNTDSFSVGFIISDPPGIDNYYRIMIAKKLNDFDSDPTDFSLADIAFNGKTYSFYSEAAYVRYDTVTVRVYSMLKEHYDYLQSADNARIANFNPFIQPARIQSNITGGLGIFTAIRYDERKIIVR